jgi:hypothetical protein
MSVTANSILRRLDQINDQLNATITELKLLVSDAGLDDSTRPGEEHRPRTGYRFVRGTHSGTYVRDPDGTDRLPAGYTIPGG